jgi:hypothetical protein
MNPRNGKIARLPIHVREEINQRLERGQPGPQILHWLNRLGPVRHILKSQFDGAPITKQNLSQWRLGGFQEWLARRSLQQDAADLFSLASNMQHDTADRLLADASAIVLAARFGSLIANWNGDVDAAFEAKSRVLNRLCRSVVQLQNGMHRARSQAFDLRLKKIEQQKVREQKRKDALTQPVQDIFKAPLLAKMYGGGQRGLKIAKYLLAVERGEFNAGINFLPTDRFDGEEELLKKLRSSARVNPPPKPRPPHNPVGTRCCASVVKPSRKPRPAQDPVKPKPCPQSNPLPPNGIDAAPAEPPPRAESDPVQVIPTSPPPPPNEPPPSAPPPPVHSVHAVHSSHPPPSPGIPSSVSSPLLDRSCSFLAGSRCDPMPD